MYRSINETACLRSDFAFPPADFGDPARSLLRRLRTWRQRAEQRRALAQLSRRLLDDAGITPRQVYEETRKPFWRA